MVVYVQSISNKSINSHKSAYGNGSFATKLSRYELFHVVLVFKGNYLFTGSKYVTHAGLL